MTVTDVPREGWWWLPGDEERRVYGRLSAGRSGAWDLDLFGTLDQEPTEEWFRRISDDNRAVPTIYGHLIKSGPEPQFVTLLDCWRRKANRTVGGVVSGARTETWAFREVVVGHGHVTEREAVSGINVRLRGLLEWSGRGRPEASWNEESASASAETIHLGTADVGDYVIELVLDHSLHHSAHGVTIAHRAHPGSWGGDAGARYLAISYGIRWILRRCLLEDLGLDGARADELVTKSHTFVGELELMRRWTK